MGRLVSPPRIIEFSKIQHSSTKKKVEKNVLADLYTKTFNCLHQEFGQKMADSSVETFFSMFYESVYLYFSASKRFRSRMRLVTVVEASPQSNIFLQLI